VTTPMHVEVRAYAELVDLLGATTTEVAVGEPRSVKDLVESVGLPHPEIDLLLVDDEPVGFDHLVRGGERVAVYPPLHTLRADPEVSLWPTPPEPRRFVLDVHLGTLARRLRLLGFDAWYATDADDAQLAEVAVAQQRILLTRDRGLLMRRAVVHGYCPRSDDPEEQAQEVSHRYGLAERARPLSRCVRCNGVLVPVDREQVLDLLPPRTRREFDRFAQCLDCHQVYWPGSHVDAVEDFVNDIIRPDDDTSQTPPPPDA
jgi:uncharacterized protein